MISQCFNFVRYWVLSGTGGSPPTPTELTDHATFSLTRPTRDMFDPALVACPGKSKCRGRKIKQNSFTGTLRFFFRKTQTEHNGSGFRRSLKRSMQQIQWIQHYSAITILNAAYKVLSQIIFRRLSPLESRFLGSNQAGFVDGRSTRDQIFMLRQILQKCREYQVPTHYLFIDFKATYDTIDREEL